MSLGTNISYLRKQNKYTQEQFAEKMNVTRQTVSRWEADEVVPELSKLVDMCNLFACKLDALVREELADQGDIYSEVKMKRVAAFKMASYVIISPNPEYDVIGYMERWAANSGLMAVCPGAKLIGWDFPFVSQEQQNRFGMRGYVAAYAIPDGFETEYPGVQYSFNKEADYAVITIKNPHVRPFERIPKAYKLIMEYIKENNYKGKPQENILSCFEQEYEKDGEGYMDVFIHVDGENKVDEFLQLN